MSGCDCPPYGSYNCAEHRLKSLDGDPAASKELVRKFTPLVGAIVQRILGQSLRAEWDDAQQVAFIRIFDRLHQWKGNAPFCKWLAVVASSRAIDYRDLTRSKRLPTTGEEVDPPAKPVTPDIKECIEVVYGRLPEEWQQVFDLTVQGMERDQVAKTVGKSPRTIQYWLAEIRERLRPCWER